MSHSLMMGQITYTFTNAGATGRFGPTQAQLNTAYASTNLNGAVTSNSGIQVWTVPYTGTYTLTAAGASGGSSSYGPAGSGIKVQSVVSLVAGQVLNIVIGQQGQSNGSTSQFYNGGSGGGGSFIYTGAIGSTGLILSAGGGGGALSSNVNVISSNISDASFSTNGNSVTDAGSYVAAGGTGGNGGGFSNRTDFYAAGGPGTGWMTDYNATYGASAPSLGGTRFNGGILTTSGKDGGFGGGGASGSNGNNGYVWAGGGGGYSGGGGGHNGGNSDGQVGGGGGSFLTGTNQLNLGTNSGDGYVIISVNDAQALNFDGVNDYVSVPNNGSLNFGTGDFSVEAYFKSSVSQPNYAGVVVKQNPGGNGGWQLVVVGNKIAAEMSSGGLSFGVGNGLQGTTTLTDGNWHHLAMVVTRSQNKIELFVDGNVESTLINSNISSMNVNFAAPMLIGVERTYAAYSNANIDEVRVWNVARTKCDLKTYKDCEIATTASGLVGNYHFNQGIASGSNPSETTLIDASGNSNNGNLTNFALTGSTSNWISPGGVISGSTTPAPAPVITASPSSTIICNSQSAVLTGGGAVTYTWSGGITNAVAFAPTSTASYTVTGTASTGCTNTAVATVNVNNCTPAAALNFDGGNDIIDIGNSMNSVLDPLNKITVEAWVKPTNNTYLGVIAGNYGTPAGQMQFLLRRDNSEFTFWVDDGTGFKVVSSGINTSTVGVWQHVAGVWDGSKTMIYINGVLKATTTGVTGTSFATTANAVKLGNNNTGTPESFAGNIDETRIWTIARTQCEINTFKNCEIATTSTGLLANYHFNQGFDAVLNTVTTLTNAASASYNGTLNNFASTGTTSNWITPGGVISGSVTPASLTPVVTANATNPVICNGGSTTLNGGGATTYIWSGGVTNGVSFSPVNTATYTVTGTNAANGCTNTAVQAVTVNPLPVVTANITNPVICNGGSTTLNGGGASTYTWSGGITNGVAFSPANTATYTVIGTNTVTGCTSTNTAAQSVTVNPLPVVTAAITNSVICEGSTTTLNGGGADTYTWTGGVTDGVAFTPIISGSYTVTGTSTLTGCSSTNAAVESVTVNTLPVVTAAITNSVICEGFSTTLNGGGADTYTWTGGVTDGVAFTPTVTGSYTVTGTNTLTGCTSTNVAVGSVTVNPNPVISAASGAICVNGSYTITPNGASTYTISGGSAIVSPSVTTSYSVTGTSVDGCTGNTAVVTVSVQSSLTVSIAGSNSVCDGNAVSLTANGAATYSWNTGSTSNTIAPTPTVNTTYSVVGSSGSCSNSAVVNITVNANPTVTAVSNTSLICAGQSVTLTASGATTFTWNSSVTGSAISDTPTTTTTYTVTGEDVNGCTNTVTFTQNVSPCTGIYANNGLSASIRVYPNPTTGMVTVEVESNATVIVLNTLGQVISSENVPAGKNQVNMKESANGIYFVRVIQDGSQQTIRLIKE